MLVEFVQVPDLAIHLLERVAACMYGVDRADGSRPDPLAKLVVVVGGGDSALEAALALAAEQDSAVKLSYRSAAFGRAKPKNRTAIDAAVADGSITVLLGSQITEITPETVRLAHNDRTVSLANDAVIVCAGGVLPTPFLKAAGVVIETKYGTQ